MIMKSNLSKVLGRLAPQQPQGAAMAPGQFSGLLGKLLAGGQQTGGVIDNRMGPGFGKPMRPPMAYPGGSSNFNESTGVYTPDDQGLRGFMSRFGGLLNKGPGRTVGYRAFDEGVGDGGPVQPRIDQRGNTIYPDGTVVADAPGTVPPWAIPPLPEVTPPAPSGGLTLATTRPDPEFNINTATNTFFKALGDRVASGQMTLDQARAAQAEMRALQLNPAMANRAAATEIAQRNLQVGPYSPNNMAQRQMMPMPAPQMPMLPLPPTPKVAAPQGLTLSNVPQQGVAPQPMAAPQGMAYGGLMAKYGGGMC